MQSLRRYLAGFLLLITLGGPLRAAGLELDQATIHDLQQAFARGELSAESLVQRYLARIATYDQAGPAINTVITLNPRALEQARQLDAERASGRIRGPLHGVPIVLKDNYDTHDLPTTAGSQLLAGWVPPDDAFVVRRLREAGAIVLAKVNLSEFASGGGSVSGATDPAILRAGRVPNGYSSMGGQTRNPHDPARGPAGSSGGTGAAIAATFAQFGLGTDTAASVRGPSAANGIVGLKTTHGLISRDGIVPLALTFDTVGPMARNVHDVAVALSVMAAVDPADPATRKGAGRAETDYTTHLRRGALRGARIGIARDFLGRNPETDRIIEQAIATLRELGAEIVDPVFYPDFALQARGGLFNLVRTAEFKAQIADYLRDTGPAYPKNIYDLARLANDPATGYRSSGKAVGLDYQSRTALDLDDPLYLAARDQGLAMIQATVTGLFDRHQLDAIVYPTSPTPASLIEAPEPAPGERSQPTSSSRGGSALNLANLSGFPDLVVPAGMTSEGLPVAISFLGRAFEEARLLGYGYDFEQATKARRLPKHTPALPGETITVPSE